MTHSQLVICLILLYWNRKWVHQVLDIVGGSACNETIQHGISRKLSIIRGCKAMHNFLMRIYFMHKNDEIPIKLDKLTYKITLSIYLSKDQDSFWHTSQKINIVRISLGDGINVLLYNHWSTFGVT